MKKNRFFGKYYKHQSLDGYVLAVIDSISNEGKMIQIITNDKAYYIKDIESVSIESNGIIFNVHEDGLDIIGSISYGNFLVPKKDVMSYYRYLPIECKHNIYSMCHRLEGNINVNGKSINFDNGYGYIEGDEGRNFPNKYLWLNAINEKASIALAIASIPLGLITITGITCLLTYQGKEYRFGTYNNAKAKLISRDHIIVKKGKYILEVFIENKDGHALKAPIKGDMVRFIHECPSVGIKYTLKHKDEIIVEITHDYASYEYVFDK